MASASIVIESATFSDGTAVSFNRNDIVILVGPNNAGKSVALRNMKEKSTRKEIVGLVVTDLTLKTAGTEAELSSWLDENFRKRMEDPQTLFNWDTLSPDDLPVTDAERALLDARLADMERNPDDQSPWPEVKARLERLAR